MKAQQDEISEVEKVPDADAEASTDVYGQAMWVQPLAEPHLEFIKGQKGVSSDISYGYGLWLNNFRSNEIYDRVGLRQERERGTESESMKERRRKTIGTN